MSRLQTMRVRPRGMGQTADTNVIPGQSIWYYGTGDALYNAFIGGPLNSLGLVSTPLTSYQLQQLAAQEQASIQKAQRGAPLTPDQLAQVQSDVSGGAAITPDVVDLSSLAGIIPKGGSLNWVLIVIIAGTALAGYKIYQAL